MPALISTLRADVSQSTLPFTACLTPHPTRCSLRSEIRGAVAWFFPFLYPAFKFVQVVLQKKTRTISFLGPKSEQAKQKCLDTAPQSCKCQSRTVHARYKMRLSFQLDWRWKRQRRVAGMWVFTCSRLVTDNLITTLTATV